MTVRYQLLATGESELLCSGIQRVYGTTYPIPEFYDSEYLEVAIAAGKLHSVVALNPQGQVVGCMSTVLEGLGDVTADGSALMVAPEYRGRGIVADLGREMATVYHRLRLAGLHLYALALHDRVQTQSQSAGAVVTGILPAWFSRRARVAGYDYPDARIGAVTLYMPLGTLPSRTCYLPPRYASLLEGIYQRLNSQRSLLVAEKTPELCENTILTTQEKRANSHLRLILERTGRDIVDLLQRQLSEGRREQFEVIYLDIPLSDIGGHIAVEAARKLGFVFGALMVDRLGSDRLRLQRYDSHLTAPDYMVIASAEARELLDFVLHETRQKPPA